jgi:hypothetical protein
MWRYALLVLDYLKAHLTTTLALTLQLGVVGSVAELSEHFHLRYVPAIEINLFPSALHRGDPSQNIANSECSRGKPLWRLSFEHRDLARE